MNVRNFRTPQEIIPRKNAGLGNSWLIGIDAGFSSLKGFAPNKIFCIPSYVKKLEGNLQMGSDTDILYSDETGLYIVGTSAQNQICTDDTSDSEAELFARNRYGSKQFEIILATGLAVGLMENNYGKREEGMPIVLQTGLPTAYLKSDSRALTKAFSKKFHFSLKVGVGSWKGYDIQIKPENISIMPQPCGTLYSVMIDDSGNYVPDAQTLLNKNVLVADVGFGTFDPYGLVNRSIKLQESIPNLGMRRVLHETSRYIYDEYGEDIRVPLMQKYLEKGYINVLDEETMKTNQVLIAPFLEKANKKVCMESIEALKNMTNYMRDYDVLIPTGGTCATWIDIYRDYFKDMKSLTIIPGNRSDKLPMLYANVRGYYMLRYMALKNGKKS